MARIYPKAEVILTDADGCTREIEDSLSGDKDLLIASEDPRLLPLPLLKRVICAPGTTYLSCTRPKYASPAKLLRKVEVRHSEVGGVTADSFSFWLSSPKSKGQPPSPTATSIRRDISFDLKAGVFGTRHDPPKGNPRMVADEIIWEGRSTLSNKSLFPWSRRNETMQVVTPLGGEYYVKRPISAEETLAFGDVSEVIVQSIPESERRALIRTVHSPLKVLNHVGILLSNLFPGRKRQGDTLCPSPKRRRVESVNPIIDQAELSCPYAQQALEEIDLLERLRTQKEGGRAKRDDAKPPTTLWDRATLPFVKVGCVNERRLLNWRRSFTLMREAMLRFWKRRLKESYSGWLAKRKTLGKAIPPEALEVARLAFTKYIPATTFWEWSGGSIPFFWNWSEEVEENVYKGVEVWIREGLENKRPWTCPQPKPPADLKEMVETKISNVLEKGYMAPGKIVALISFFAVPKGTSDIRMVYDATKSGLNDYLDAPWFPLPTEHSLLRQVRAGTYMADNDMGECFYNWILDSRASKHTGVDISCLFGNQSRTWIHWKRPAMGMTPSPIISGRHVFWLKEMTFADRQDQSNIFRWDRIELNLPGSASYDPTMPWVSKRRRDGELAADTPDFVDDRRPTAPTEKECWEASQVLAKEAAKRGAQDASRKRTAPSRSPGPWAGISISTDNGEVCMFLDTKKWKKLKGLIATIREAYDAGPDMSHKELESIRGFVVYSGRTYPSLVPYFKGIHGTLDSWRPGRVNGFKIKEPPKKRQRRAPQQDDWEEPDVALVDGEFQAIRVQRTREQPPKRVAFIERMGTDLAALELLTASETAPKRRVRPQHVTSLLYAFGDASGKGLGASLRLPDGRMRWRRGVWGRTISDETSSNYKELRNLVEQVEEAENEGELLNCEMWFFTDNLVAESVFYRGSSKSPALHELVLRMRQAEMRAGATLYVVHVAGKRMIASGVDGISRGDDLTGVMAGEDMLSFVPLNESCLDRHGGLAEWVSSWAGELEVMEPTRWAEAHLTGGTYLWCPPPAAARDALEMMALSIMGRPHSTHIFAVPRLMTGIWRKTLGKATDLLFEIPVGTRIWERDMYEPLIIGISLPYSRSEPWRHKFMERTQRVECRLRGMREAVLDLGPDPLRKLLNHARAVRGLR